MAKKKLTKAEKQALKQKEKEEFENKMKKDRLDTELGFTKAQVSEMRRKVLERAQLVNLPIIREEWLHKWGFFERTVDWKDFYISQLRDDLYYYELHHRLTEQRHNENMEQLLGVYGEAVEKVMVNYTAEREKLLRERRRQEMRLTLTQARRAETMESVLGALDEQRRAALGAAAWTNSNQHQLKLFRYEEAVARIAQEGDEEIRELWAAMKNIFDKYKSTTSKKRQEYLMMKQRDLAEKDSLEKISRRMTQLYKTIKKCRGRLGRLRVDEGMRLELQTRRATQDQLKMFTRACLEQSAKQLETLSLISTRVLRKMEGWRDRAVEAVTLISICRGLETQDERAAPRLANNPPLALFGADRPDIVPLLDDLEGLWSRTLHIKQMNCHMSSQVAALRQQNQSLNHKLASALAAFNNPPAVQ